MSTQSSNTHTPYWWLHPNRGARKEGRGGVDRWMDLVPCSACCALFLATTLLCWTCIVISPSWTPLSSRPHKRQLIAPLMSLFAFSTFVALFNTQVIFANAMWVEALLQLLNAFHKIGKGRCCGASIWQILIKVKKLLLLPEEVMFSRLLQRRVCMFQKYFTRWYYRACLSHYPIQEFFANCLVLFHDVHHIRLRISSWMSTKYVIGLGENL